VAVVTLPGDRRDDLLAACAQVVADGVGRAVLYDDEDPRGRQPGEVSALVEREMRARRPKLRSVRAGGYREAVVEAVAMAQPGDVVLVLYERLAPVMDLLGELGAGRGSDLPVLPMTPAPGAVAAPARDLVRDVLLR
jgi:cyanophycin synthetase